MTCSKAWRGVRPWRAPGASRSGSGDTFTSSARTCSAPGRSRSAAPTCRIARLCRRASGPAAWSRPAPATTRRASRWRRRCSASGRRSSCPRARRCRRWPRPAATAREVALRRAHRRRGAGRRAGVRRGDRGGASSTPSTTPTSIAGQGTVGLEILEQCPEVRDRRGLGRRRRAAGRRRRGGEGAAARRAGGRRAGGGRRGVPGLAGRRASRSPLARRWRRWPTASRSAGPATCPSRSIRELVDEVVTVSEESLSRALLLLPGAGEAGRRAGRRRGGRGAAWPTPGRSTPPVVAVLSGGNIDPLLLMRVIRHGLAAAGRYLALRLRIPDRPGALADAAQRARRGGRERAGRRAPADRPVAAPSARSRWRSSWRRAGSRTPRR